MLLSGALRPSVVIGFLTLNSEVWNPTLLVLMITIVVTNMLTFLLVVGKTIPIYEEGYQLLTEEQVSLPPQPEAPINRRIIAGAAVFGAGWALSGICPGTLISGAIFTYSHALLFLGGIILGMIALGMAEQRMNKQLSVHDHEPISI